MGATFQTTKEIDYAEDTIRFPREMSFVFAPDDASGNTFARDARMLYPFVVQGDLTCGRVAEILGTDRLTVMDFYESSGLPWLAYGAQDLQKDINTLRELHGRR
ncbi:MAG: UPF0175 family protein [Atopobiaceae bacterium]|nr:UPF0175 family protein [Atopobiaceae bacterium]